jgi:ABC-type glycerol-3-phosphate transport system substrate-binding protein
VQKLFPIGSLCIFLAGLFCLSGCNVIIPEPRDEYVDGRLRITYWEKWTGFEGEAIQRVVDSFNARQNRIYVDLITMSQIDRKALVAIAGGDPPDLVGLWSAGMPQFAEKRALMPLEPFMEKAGMRREDFIDVFLELNTYRGTLYGLPTTPATTALHWNKRMFREAGLDPDCPPRTLAELDEMAEKLTKYDENGRLVQVGFTPSEPGWWHWSWGYWFGGRLWDGENITFATPENLAAYEWIESYPEKYGAEELRRFQSGVAGQFASPQNAFFSERVAMVIQGVWMANFIQTYAPDLEWGAAPFPSAVPGLENVTMAECDSICIPTGARHPEEAFEFIQYLCSHEGMEMLNLAQKKFTPLKEVSPEFLADHPNPYIETFIDLAESPNVFHSPIMSIWFEYNDEITPAFDRVMFGQTSPEDAVAHVQKRVSAMWRRTRERIERRAAAEKDE